jgi:hypothetical protein
VSDAEAHNPYAPPTVDVASAASESGLKRRSVWLMVLLIFVTLGVYYPVWFFRRRGGLNRLNSPRKLALWPLVLFAAYFLTYIAIELIAGEATVQEAYGDGVAFLLGAVRLGIGIMMVVQCFAIKDIIEDHAQGPDDPDGDRMFKPQVKLSGLMTFFFSIFYLQHAINKYVVDARAV